MNAFIYPKAGAIKLTLCMIVRDSSRTLGSALNSIRPWVDEMIVVDTGSRDNTPQIAGELGARVFHFPWCDDFSAARNESLRHARGTWLFWMDSDDTIDAANGGKLQELARRSSEGLPMAYVMQVHCPGGYSTGVDDVTVVDHIKMFRNLPELRFEGRIHEQILPSIRRQMGTVEWSDIYVVHSGSDRTLAGRQLKQERDLRLLLLDAQDRPNHPFVLFNLGMTYADMGRHEDAVAALRRSLEVAGPGESHVPKAYALLACSLMQLGQLEDSGNACKQGLKLFPKDAELHFRLGLAAQRQEEWEEAINAYRRVLTESEERRFQSRDRGITGYKARQNLAMALAEKGRHDLAELQWRQVISELPTYRAGWRGLTETLLKQKRFTTVDIELSLLPDEGDLGAEKARLQIELAIAQRNAEQARYALLEAGQRFPEDLELLRTRCRFFFEQGDDGLAEQLLVELRDRQPDDAAAHHNLGTIYLCRNRLEAAADCFENSLRLRPDYAPTRQQLARVKSLLQTNKTPSAIPRSKT